MMMLMEWTGRPLQPRRKNHKSRAKNLQHFKSIYLANGNTCTFSRETIHVGVSRGYGSEWTDEIIVNQWIYDYI